MSAGLIFCLSLAIASSSEGCTKEKIKLLISEDVRKFAENNNLYNYQNLLTLSENELSELVAKNTIKNPLHELDGIKHKLSEHIVKENPSSPKSKHSTNQNMHRSISK